MTTLHERIETPLPLQDTFDFIADFSNSARWDPGVATATRLDDRTARDGVPFRPRRPDGRPGVADGIRHHDLAAATAGRPDRVGLGRRRGRRHSVRGDAKPARVVDYIADIRLRGALRLVAPLAGGAFARIARDARDGMQRALDERATAG